LNTICDRTHDLHTLPPSEHAIYYTIETGWFV